MHWVHAVSDMLAYHSASVTTCAMVIVIAHRCLQSYLQQYALHVHGHDLFSIVTVDYR